ncbi:43694_t:CDS:2 [Gigaspora margarita]|uniref:43694_t:CDS:1 n=1 Tax=Gigaspora margarita TaxID=4874 RepID=A0ABN7UXN6_GIGMA|nr:43694_t:CDS:2 [Gigaspora margarita]
MAKMTTTLEAPEPEPKIVPKKPVEEPVESRPNVVTKDALEELQQQVTLQNQKLEHRQTS